VASGGKADIAASTVATPPHRGADSNHHQRHGRIDILVASAGIAIDGLPCASKTEDPTAFQHQRARRPHLRSCGHQEHDARGNGAAS